MGNIVPIKFQTIKSTETEKFPFVGRFNNYPEYLRIQDSLKKKYNQKNITIMSEKVDCDGNGMFFGLFYYGLFWIRGNKPNEKEVQELMKKFTQQKEVDKLQNTI